jgi:ABC-2 type transport system permease protein
MLALARLIIRHWDLIWGLALKDLKVRYKSAFLGFLWSLLTPLFMAFIFFIVFSKIIPMNIERFPLFLLCALFPWNFSQLCISAATVSIVGSGHIIKKVYFPREAVPISVVFSNSYNFILSLIILLLVIPLSGAALKPAVIFLPVVILCQFVFTLGVSLFFCGLNAYYRDVKYFVEIFLTGWFYLTPIFYPAELIPAAYRKLYLLNPMAVVVNLYRKAMLYGDWPQGAEIAYLILSSIAVYFIGQRVFKRYEPLFADMV